MDYVGRFMILFVGFLCFINDDDLGLFVFLATDRAGLMMSCMSYCLLYIVGIR